MNAPAPYIQKLIVTQRAALFQGRLTATIRFDGKPAAPKQTVHFLQVSSELNGPAWYQPKHIATGEIVSVEAVQVDRDGLWIDGILQSEAEADAAIARFTLQPFLLRRKNETPLQNFARRFSARPGHKAGNPYAGKIITWDPETLKIHEAAA